MSGLDVSSIDAKPAAADDTRILVPIERESGRFDIYAKRRALQQAERDRARLSYWCIKLLVATPYAERP